MMGFLDDLFSSDSSAAEQEAYEEGQDSGAHHGPVTQAFDSLASALGSSMSDHGDKIHEAFEAGQENGRDNPDND
jgi:hypothetical protein